MRRLRRRHIIRITSPLLPYMPKGWREWITHQLRTRQSRAWDGVKRYIPAEMPVEKFFKQLDNEGIRVVVLRWFEDLPYIQPGKDIDVLIPDDAVEPVQALMSCGPQGQRIDCYSETGLRGTGYVPPSAGSISAFPPEIAVTILQNAQKCEGGWWVPAPREHALALAYHAVYLKGLASGLPPDSETQPQTKGSHDYAAVVTELMARVGIVLEQPVTMSSLEWTLAQEGWRPPLEHLRQLASHNPWIESKLL